MDRLLELTRRAERAHFWFRGFRWFVRPHLQRAVAGRTGLTLLDAGCGTGANLALLAPHGRAVGFDLTWSGLAAARAYGHAPVAQASLLQIPFLDASFDLVTAFDVLQCVAGDDAAGMRELARVLKPGGTLVLNVAAFEALRGGHAALSAEARRYTPADLRARVEGAGLRITTLTCTNASLLPITWPTRVWQRWRAGGRAPTSEADIVIPPAPVNAVLTALLWLESWVVRAVSLPVGSSILCVAAKPAHRQG